MEKIAEAQKILEMNLRQQAEYFRVKEEEEEAESFAAAGAAADEEFEEEGAGEAPPPPPEDFAALLHSAANTPSVQSPVAASILPNI